MAEKKAKKTTVKTVVTDGETTAVTNRSSLIDARPNLRAPLAACVAELLGTFMLAAAVIAVQGQPLFTMFALIAIVLIVGQLSGAHLNPAITFGAWVTRRITGLRAIGYAIAQVVGAMLAVLVMTALLDQTPTQNPMTGASEAPKLFAATPLAKGHEWTAFFAEVLGTSVLAFAVAGALRQTERISGAFMVGGGLLLGLLISGATVVLNPAVAMAIKAFDLNQMVTVGIYGVGALLGGAIGFGLHLLLTRESARTTRLKN